MSPAPDTPDAARRRLLTQLPGELAQQVERIGKRREPQDIRALIMALCAHQPWRADELATLLDRRADTLRREYLRPMMRDGLLVLTRPDKPNDPQQAYTAVKEQE